jgi:hypothetical protein
MSNALETIYKYTPFIPKKGPDTPDYATQAVSTGIEEGGNALDQIFAPGGPLAQMGADATRGRAAPGPYLNKPMGLAMEDLAGAGQHTVAPTQQVTLDPAMLDHARNILAARRAATAQANTDLNGIRGTVNGGGPSAAAIQQDMALSAAHRAAGAQMGAARGGNMVMAANGAGAPQALQAVGQGGAARAGELSTARGNLLQGSAATTAGGIQTDQGATDLSRLQNTVQLGNVNALGGDAATASSVFGQGANTAGKALSTLSSVSNDWNKADVAKINAEDDAKLQYQNYLDSLFGQLQAIPSMTASGSIAKQQAAQQQADQITGAASKAGGALVNAFVGA